jgi:hypothetical protein
VIRHELITSAPNGSDAASIRWDLTEGKRYELNQIGGVIRTGIAPVVVEGGVEGLGHPQIEVYGQETPRRPGRQRTGARVKPRKCFLPVFFDADGVEWAAVHRLFWKCVTPVAPVLWRVTAPDGRSRQLFCYLDPQSGAYSTDPSLSFENEPLDFLADDPFWQGAEQVAALVVTGNGIGFFGVDGASGPPFHIQPSGVAGTHQFVVDGNVDAWPLLEVVGPVSDWSVTSGRDGSKVGGMQLYAGDRLVIDFDPTAQAVMLARDGVEVNVTDVLPHKQFFQLIADGSGEMTVGTEMFGEGHLKLTYKPRYWRAI